MTVHLHKIHPSIEEEPKYRILPHNQEAEQGLLGALLVDNRALENYLSREEPSQRATDSIEQFEQDRMKWQQRIENVKNITEVIVAKHRNGPIGAAKLYFDPHLTRFEDLVRNG